MKSMNELAREIHDNAKDHGWWDEERGFPEMIALCHAELSEALEEYRDNRPPLYYCCHSLAVVDGDFAVCVPDPLSPWHEQEPTECDLRGEKPEGIAVELADCLIRILDYCAHSGIDIEEAVKVKMAYNQTRPYRHGGKRC